MMWRAYADAYRLVQHEATGSCPLYFSQAGGGDALIGRHQAPQNGSRTILLVIAGLRALLHKVCHVRQT